MAGVRVSALLPTAMADDACAIRSLLVAEAGRAGHAVPAEALVATRVLVEQDWIPDEWRPGPVLYAEVECYPIGSGS